MIDQLFARLLVRYGAKWLQMWDQIDIEAVKADWMQALERVSPDSVRHALDHLPTDWPPNATQFRDLCRGKPVLAALPAPAGSRNSDAARAALERMREVAEKKPDPLKGREWAVALKERHERGGNTLTLAQIDMYRDALRQSAEYVEAE